ncbi:hypothetical protein HOK51_07015 [Candidatus Woesearchaeota archaeon]|jgi:hypothetical protein|nr:hypothetical protein [Candidatus Woesearchaeota archaeon]MBT6519573.1 hypothetical protein [Candidatus Woesearchaeota archaeon]MBT7367682.1 hypothetical protein [Candidatus Woesearchaeota archaeon]
MKLITSKPHSNTKITERLSVMEFIGKLIVDSCTIRELCEDDYALEDLEAVIEMHRLHTGYENKLGKKPHYVLETISGDPVTKARVIKIMEKQNSNRAEALLRLAENESYATMIEKTYLEHVKPLLSH